MGAGQPKSVAKTQVEAGSFKNATSTGGVGADTSAHSAEDDNGDDCLSCEDVQSRRGSGMTDTVYASVDHTQLIDEGSKNVLDSSDIACLDVGDSTRNAIPDSFEVRLERKSGEAWGFAWHVGAYAQKRLLVAGVDPSSPAGRWGAIQSEQGLRGIERGDELLSVNSNLEHGTMRRELVAADEVQLVFLRAEAAGADAGLGFKGGVRSALPKKYIAPIAPPTVPSKETEEVVSPPVCIKNTFLHVHEVQDTDEVDAFARSDPGPIARLDFGRRGSPYTPGCLGGVNLPAHVAVAKMAAGPPASLDGSGTGSSLAGWSTAKSSSDSNVGSPKNGPAPRSDEASRGNSMSRTPSVATEWDFPTPYVSDVHHQTLQPTAEGSTPTSPTSEISPLPGSMGLGMSCSTPSSNRLRNAPLPSPSSANSMAGSVAASLERASLDPEPISEEIAATECTASSASNSQKVEAQRAAPKAPEMKIKNTFIEVVEDDDQECDFNNTTKTMPDVWTPGLLQTPTAGPHGFLARNIRDIALACSTEEGRESIAAKLEAERGPPPGTFIQPAPAPMHIQTYPQSMTQAARPPNGVGQAESALVGGGEYSDDQQSGDEEEGVVEETPQRRKKPTRRAGRRARHRRCHAAEARRLAEEARLAEEGAVGGTGPSTGQQISAVPSRAMGTETMKRPTPPKLDGIDSVPLPLIPVPKAQESPVRRGGRPPKKSVLAAQAAGKVAATPDILGLGLQASMGSPMGSPTGIIVGMNEFEDEATSSTAPPPDAEELLGKQVRVTGLIRQPEFNGQWGRIEKYDAALQRFVVNVQREVGPPVLAKLRRENLIVPKTLALRFDDENSGVAVKEATAPPPSCQAPWLAEPAFVSCPPPDSLASVSALQLDESNCGGTDDTSPLAEVSMSSLPAKSQTGKEGTEKWRPTLRHWALEGREGPDMLDSSNSMHSVNSGERLSQRHEC